MQEVGLPEALVQLWGNETSREFIAWLDDRLHIAQSRPQVQISAFVARQKVNVLMLEQVSNLLLASKPQLEQLPSEDWVWRVPIDLTFPSHGRVGRVGEIIVDAHYGRVYYDDAALMEISNNAEQLAQQTLAPSS